MTRVYLDMDGVLIDFDAGLKKFNVVNNTAQLNIPKEQWTPLQIALDKQVLDCMKTPGFFSGLPKMPGADALWDVAQSTGYMSVLTALPRTTDDGKRVHNEKFTSITKHFNLREGDEFLTCLKSEKQNFATNPDTSKPNILVDDLKSNIDEWNARGGLGILFINMDQAVADLKKVTYKV